MQLLQLEIGIFWTTLSSILFSEQFQQSIFPTFLTILLNEIGVHLCKNIEDNVWQCWSLTQESTVIFNSFQTCHLVKVHQDLHESPWAWLYLKLERGEQPFGLFENQGHVKEILPAGYHKMLLYLLLNHSWLEFGKGIY